MTEKYGPLRLIQRLFVLKILNLRTTWKGIIRNRGCRVGAPRRRTRLELFRVFRWDLSNFEQADLALVINERSTLFNRPCSAMRESIIVERGADLDISLGLIGDLHEEFSLGVDHVLEDPLVDTDRGGRVNQCSSVGMFLTYTAPRLSEFETNRYSFPSAIS